MDPGAIVLVKCIEPKEQLWGRLERLDTAGVVLRGIDLRSFDDWMRELGRDPEEASLGLATMFVPMFRIERIFVDERVGQVPSYREQLQARIERPVEELLASRGEP